MVLANWSFAAQYYHRKCREISRNHVGQFNGVIPSQTIIQKQSIDYTDASQEKISISLVHNVDFANFTEILNGRHQAGRYYMIVFCYFKVTNPHFIVEYMS